MNKTIKTELALAVIVIFAVALGIFSVVSDKQMDDAVEAPVNVAAKDETPKKDCEHYYEGAADIKAWLLDGSDEKKMIVQLDPADVKNLPAAGVAAKGDATKVVLVDASADMRNELKESAAGAPVKIAIQGFAVTCDSALPLISLEPATKAFKKS